MIKNQESENLHIQIFEMKNNAEKQICDLQENLKSI